MVRTLDIQGYHDKADGTAAARRARRGGAQGVREGRRAAPRRAAQDRAAGACVARVPHADRRHRRLPRPHARGGLRPPPEAVEGVVGRVRGNASHLLALVEEFLDLFAPRDARRGRPRARSLSLSTFLRELGESFSLLVRGRPVEFLLRSPGRAADGARRASEALHHRAEPARERDQVHGVGLRRARRRDARRRPRRDHRVRHGARHRAGASGGDLRPLSSARARQRQSAEASAWGSRSRAASRA